MLVKEVPMLEVRGVADEGDGGQSIDRSNGSRSIHFVGCWPLLSSA